MKQFYEDYWMVERPPPTGDPLTALRLSRLWSLLEGAESSGGVLLDCGSGEGHLVAAAIDKGFRASGVELSDVARDRANERYPGYDFLAHSVEDLPWPIAPSTCDVVVAFELIEHLLRPQEFLLGARDALRSGGYMAITTPYHGRVKNLALSLVGFERHFDVKGPHIRFFTDKALHHLLSEAGLRVERTMHYGRFWPLWAGVMVWAKKL